MLKLSDELHIRICLFLSTYKFNSSEVELLIDGIVNGQESYEQALIEKPYLNIYQEQSIKNDIFQSYLPCSSFEGFLKKIYLNSNETISQYDLSVDRISLDQSFSFHFQDHINDFDHLWLRLSQLIRDKNFTKEAVSYEFMQYLYGTAYLVSNGFIQSYIESGAYLYSSPNLFDKPLDDLDQGYKSILNWEVIELGELDEQKRKKLSKLTFFPIDLEDYYFSKLELEHIYRFSVPDSCKTEYERKIYVNAYRNFIDKDKTLVNRAQSNFKKDTTALRAAFFKGWLGAQNISESYVFEETQKQIWEKLGKVDPKLFPPSSTQTIEAFFQSHRLATFKVGRRKK